MKRHYFQIRNFLLKHPAGKDYFLTHTCRETFMHLINLWQMIGIENSISYSCNELAQELPFSQRTIERHIKQLCDEKLIIKKFGKCRKNEYKLHDELLDKFKAFIESVQTTIRSLSVQHRQSVGSIYNKNNNNKNRESREVSSTNPRATHLPSPALCAAYDFSHHQPDPVPNPSPEQNIPKVITDNVYSQPSQKKNLPSPSPKTSAAQFKPTQAHRDLANARKLTREQRAKLLAKFKAHPPYQLLGLQKLNEKFAEWIESERVETTKPGYVPQIKSRAYREYKSDLPVVTREERAYGAQQISSILASLQGKAMQYQGARL